MNAIDIFKQVGVLIPPISLEKQAPVDPYIYRPKKFTLGIEHLTSHYKSTLTVKELNVVCCFIYHGGIGRDAAIKTQNDWWEAYKGRTIDILVSAIRKGGWDEKQVLWDMYPLGYNHKGELGPCQPSR